MIVPMKKVCVMVQDKHRQSSLKKLRDIGVLHIEKNDAPIDANSTAQKLKIKVEDAIGLISGYKPPKKKKKVEYIDDGAERRREPVGLHRGRRASDVFGTVDEAPYSLDAVIAVNRPFLPDLMLGFAEERRVLKEKDAVLNKEISRVEGWGDFEPSAIYDIIEYGLPVFFYELTAEALANINKDAKYIKINGDKNNARIIVFYEPLANITPFQIPEKPLNILQLEMKENKISLDAKEEKIKSFANRKPALDKDMLNIQQDLEFEAATAGMSMVEDTPPEFKLSYITGYIPASDVKHVKEAAKDNNWALSIFDPSKEDAPPTKIENNSLVRLINPLLSFLGTVPGYREFDISPSYLFFFTIFFSMILGDAGYGLLLFAVACILAFSMKMKKGTVPDVIKLMLLLTFSTIIWGTVNGSWFQIPYANLPYFLTVLILPPFNNMGPVVEFPAFLQNVFRLPAEVPVDVFKTRWNVQFLCFSLALIQLVWARGKRIIAALPRLSALAQFGTLIMLAGLYFLVLNMLLGIEFPPFALPLIIAGVGLNLLFAEQNGGNFFKNILKGLSNFFQLFLKAVGCFADIISYIRLFAVGLAGATIAEIFNNMAVGDGLGDFGVMFFVRLVTAVLILAVGHGLNLVLTALSVIVHGVRLNLLEYAGNHLEMEWSGYLYSPFAKKQKK
ncbi:MAG: V-type ATP synthase subunit I [Treponema sp.]|nr:V-type ATP synthase subunit I [Treponema sp.]